MNQTQWDIPSIFSLSSMKYKTGSQNTILSFLSFDYVSLKESGSIVQISNNDLSQWSEIVEEDDALECTNNRLGYKAICMTFSGQSHRGSDREQIELDFVKFR